LKRFLSTCNNAHPGEGCRTSTSCQAKLAELVGAQETPEELCKRIDERYKTYRKWAFETWIEALRRIMDPLVAA
jgi:hypothetical protein